MIDVKDRIPASGKANRKKLTFDDGSVQYAVVEFADDAPVEGTPVNRLLFNDLQGFSSRQTVFKADGSIVETDPVTGVVKTTVFNSDGSITETRTSEESSIQKVITFQDGSVTEVVS